MFICADNDRSVLRGPDRENLSLMMLNKSPQNAKIVSRLNIYGRNAGVE